MTTNSKENRPLGGLVGDLMRDAVVLVRQEIQLAKAEASEKLSTIGSGVAALFIGALVVLSGFLVLLDAAVYFITDYFYPDVPMWLSALLVGAIVTSIGLFLLLKARSSFDVENFTPRRTIRSISRDTELLKEKL